MMQRNQWKKICLILLGIGVVLQILLPEMQYKWTRPIMNLGKVTGLKTGEPSDLDRHVTQINTSSMLNFTHTSKNDSTQTDIKYLICWYRPIHYLTKRPDAFKLDFQKCEHKNCRMTSNKNDANRSDAVLFDGYKMGNEVNFKRPRAQIWVFVAHEPPLRKSFRGTSKHSYNWTMTFDKENTDIHLPYGEFRKYKEPVVRDFRQIAKLKQKGALWIASNCHSNSKREQVVETLREYIDIEVLGKCGKPWTCGKHHVHDDCFLLLNTTYKFYLAFESTLCRRYFTEKLYENFQYDTIQIVRGGEEGEASLHPKGTIIATDDFRSIHDLGKYLQRLSASEEEYADMLAKKSQYYTIGYTEGLYQRALCDLCERMNNQDKYHKEIPDIKKWHDVGVKSCRAPTDIYQ